MDLREEYERFQKAQQEAPKLIAKAQAYGSTTSDRARAAAARRDADPERMLKKIAEARAKESRDIDRLVPSELQHALLALMRLEINNLLPHPLRGLTECYTDDEAPLAAMLDAQGQAYWGRAPEGGGACWNGKAVDFYGNQILSLDVTDSAEILGKYIVYHTGLSPTKHALATWPKNVSKGPWAWDMIVRGSPWISWEVGGDEVKDEAGNSYSSKRYELAVGKTCGTIHIPVPIATPEHRLAYQNIQMGAGSGTSKDDNGILAQYPRTH